MCLFSISCSVSVQDCLNLNRERVFVVNRLIILFIHTQIPTAAPGKPKGEKSLLVTLSSDEDMIDITHQGTVNEVHDPEDDTQPQATSTESNKILLLLANM